MATLVVVEVYRKAKKASYWAARTESGHDRMRGPALSSDAGTRWKRRV